ncbi:MAG: acetylornithine deacetylase [Deinococcus-Thermus bacterium]|nr:acetylornithine deacetylase [Deinococcota bacterium]
MPDPAASAESLDWLGRLIAVPTVSRDSNLALIETVRDYLAGLGIDSRLTHDDDGRKANLWATVGPETDGGVVLSGHTDVVPVDDQDWSHDPFDMVTRDGKVFGRGTADMKGFIAAVLAALPRLMERGLERPVHLAFSYDEEVGCLGVRRLIDDIRAHVPVRPAACIVGEPTLMVPVIGHKAKLSMRCHVQGLEGHSALAPQGVNAVEYAAELIVRLRRMADDKRLNGPFDDGFDPPHTTVHTGVMHGGTALNIVPNHARFDFEFRALPSEDPRALFDEIARFAAEELVPQMRAVCVDAGIDFEEISGFPGLDMPEDHEVTTLVKALSGANRTGKVAFGTEAGLFQEAGLPTIVCGPGSITQAHKPDEWLALEELGRCERLLDRLGDRLCREAAA